MNKVIIFVQCKGKGEKYFHTGMSCDTEKQEYTYIAGYGRM